MKFNPPTQLVLFMFLSFGVVLGTMILLFRPPSVPRPVSAVALLKSSADSSKGLAVNTGRTSAPGLSLGLTATKVDSGRGRAQGQRDLNLLKTEVESRLKTEMALEEQKIAQLARLCSRMEPGQAAVAISSLDEITIRRVLSQLDRDSALRIQSVLVRIRRGNG